MDEESSRISWIRDFPINKLVTGIGISATLIGTGITLASWSIPIQSSYAFLIHFIPLLSRALNTFGVIIAFWTFASYLIFPIFLPLYASADKRAVSWHIKGRFLGILYNAHGALRYYSKALDKLGKANERAKQKGKNIVYYPIPPL